MFGSQLSDSVRACTGLETRLSRCPHRFNIDKGRSNGDNIHRPKSRVRIRRCLPNNIESGGVGRGQLGGRGAVQDSFHRPSHHNTTQRNTAQHGTVQPIYTQPFCFIHSNWPAFLVAQMVMSPENRALIASSAYRGSLWRWLGAIPMRRRWCHRCMIEFTRCCAARAA